MYFRIAQYDIYNLQRFFLGDDVIEMIEALGSLAFRDTASGNNVTD